MHTLLVLLGIAGFLAVATRAVRTALRLLHGGADELLTRQLSKTRAQRGDLTGLQEAETHRQLAQRRRRLALGALVLWGGLLLLPPLTPWPALLYALYALLWLVPHGGRP